MIRKNTAWNARPFSKEREQFCFGRFAQLDIWKELVTAFCKSLFKSFRFRHRPEPPPLASVFSMKPRLFPHPSRLSDGRKAIHAWWSGSEAGWWSWSQLWRCCMDVGWACPPASWGSWLWCWASWAGYHQASVAESVCSREAKRAVRGLRAALHRTRGASGWPAGTHKKIYQHVSSRNFTENAFEANWLVLINYAA